MPAALANKLVTAAAIVLSAALLWWLSSPDNDQAIAPQQLRDWVTYLSSEPLQGRGNGSAGIAMAARWIAKEFSSAGLQPPPTQLDFFQSFEQQGLQHRNILGYLPGSDPALTEQYIVLSAHYDHLGVVDGQIMPGADDNASGVAMLIALARLLQSKEIGRSILFAAWSGEELDLVGSRYYSRHPLLPLRNASVNLNFEMLGHSSGLGKQRLWLTGAEHSTLLGQLQTVAATQGWQISADPQPELGLFWRSDNAALALLQIDEQGQRYGIPAHSISSWGQESHYHQPSDRAEAIDYRQLSMLSQLLTTAVVALSQQPATHWHSPNALSLQSIADWPNNRTVVTAINRPQE